MQWLIVSWFLAFGYVPVQNVQVESSHVVLHNELIATVAQIGIEATFFDRFKVFTDIETFQYLINLKLYKGGLFSPFKSNYTFGASFYFTDYFSLTAYHKCDHMVYAGPVNYDQGSSITKIYIKLTGKTYF